jgi:prephenate dehydratase
MISIGIQGGKGSYNEEACNHFAKIQGIKDYQIKYLYTSEKVLEKLHLGNVDYAQFAIVDAAGEIVYESIEALTKYTCKIVDRFDYPLHHHLLIHKEAKIDDIKTIMTHPQILKECSGKLKEKYPKVKTKVGKGDSIDQGKVAEDIDLGKIDKTTGVIGSKVIAEIYPNLQIVDDDIQDRKDLTTTFMVCKRRYII